MSHRYMLAAIGTVLICLGYLSTSKVDIQLNVHSGELRKRYTAFGLQTHIAHPWANALSRVAASDGAGYDWLTVSTRSYSRQPCKEDWKTLITCVRNICDGSGNQEESKEFARSVLEELNGTRSLSQTTRHVLRVLELPLSDNTRPSLMEAWKITAQDSAFRPPSPSGVPKLQILE
jgi:hypothetical protein